MDTPHTPTPSRRRDKLSVTVPDGLRDRLRALAAACGGAVTYHALGRVALQIGVDALEERIPTAPGEEQHGTTPPEK